jgi:hypothetical protein
LPSTTYSDIIGVSGDSFAIGLQSNTYLDTSVNKTTGKTLRDITGGSAASHEWAFNRDVNMKLGSAGFELVTDYIANHRVKSYNSSVTGATWSLWHARGTEALPTTLLAGDVVGQISFIGHTDAFQNAGNITCEAESGWGATGTDTPTRYVFRLPQDGTSTSSEMARMTSNGRMAVGLNGSILAPLGTIHANGIGQPQLVAGASSILYWSQTTAVLTGITTADITGGDSTAAYKWDIAAVNKASLSTSAFTLTSVPINEAQGATIASASTTDIGAATGNYLDVSGTTTITALGTVQAGTERTVRFTGILTLTHNATSLILPSAANITTAANDAAMFRSLGSGNWQCVSYTRASGTALVSGGGSITAVSPWAASTAVAANEVRRKTILGVEVYMRSITARTTLATFDATEASNWQYIGQNTPATTFTASVGVPVGVRLFQNGREYYRNSSGLTGATFSADAAGWLPGDATEVTSWAANTYYPMGSVYKQTILGTICTLFMNINRTSGATYGAPEVSASTLISQDKPAVTFTAGDAAPVGLLLTQGGRTYYRNSNSVLGASFVAEVTSWTINESVEVPAWTANRYYAVGSTYTQLIMGAECVLRNISSRQTGATFDATEASLVALVGQERPSTTFAAGVAVPRGLRFLSNNVVYYRANSGTTGASFTADIGNWTAETIGVAVQPWSGNTFVLANELRRQTIMGAEVTMRNSTARTTSATFDATEVGFWTVVGQNIQGAFAATTVVPAGFTIASGTRILKRNANGTTGATIVADIASWTMQQRTSVPVWAASSLIMPDELSRQTIMGVEVTLRNSNATARSTNATFDAAEAANQTLVSQETPATAFSASAVVPRGFLFRNGVNATYWRTATGTTGASFAADIANWTQY